MEDQVLPLASPRAPRFTTEASSAVFEFSAEHRPQDALSPPHASPPLPSSITTLADATIRPIIASPSSTSNPSPASEAVNKNREADLYGMRVNLLDGGEIRGAGNVWISPEGEVDESAMDVNLAGNLFFEKVVNRYFTKFSDDAI